MAPLVSQRADLRYEVCMTIYVVAPAYNERDSISAFLDEIDRVKTSSALSCKRLVVLIVDDGSRDDTSRQVEQSGSRLGHIEVRLVKLSRNFGHQAAIQAGLAGAFSQAAQGDVFVILDADLQHPPELIPDMISYLERGFHHVQMVREDSSDNSSSFKRWTSQLFYRFFHFFTRMELPQGGADFRAVSYDFLKAYLKMAEVNRFNRGLFHWLGFRTATIPYKPRSRFAGETKYSFSKMFCLAIRGVTLFSNRPLVLTHLFLTVSSLSICVLYLGYEMTKLYRGHQFEPGWLTVVCLVSLWGGLLAFGNLVTSLYLAFIFDEVKKRPIYIVESEAWVSARVEEKSAKLVS